MIAITLKDKRYFVEVDDKKAIVQKVEPVQEPDWNQLPDFDDIEQSAADIHTVTAVMPCTICKVSVQPEQGVRNGDVLFICEAMKMELEIRASIDGVVTEVMVEKGDHVEKGQLLARICVRR